jgi:hypothetical protein
VSGTSGQNSSAVTGLGASVIASTSISLGASSSSPLTYNASGLLNSFQQATSNKTTSPNSSVQAVQSTILAVENAVTQTLGSLAAGSSSNSPATDIFGSADTASTNPPSSSKSSTMTPASNNSNLQAAQSALLSAENVVTKTRGLLA